MAQETAMKMEPPPPWETSADGATCLGKGCPFAACARRVLPPAQSAHYHCMGRRLQNGLWECRFYTAK